MTSKITVACVYWQGKFRGREAIYKPVWVERLQRMIHKNLPLSHTFSCLTNSDEVKTRTVPLVHNYPGWWSKIELFRPGVFKTKWVLYFDLDLVVMKDLSPLCQKKSASFTAVSAMPSDGKIQTTKDGKVVRLLNSSVMFFNTEEMSSVYERFNESVMKDFRGDQDWLGHLVQEKAITLSFYDHTWITKLRYCPGHGKKPSHAAKVILCMPGKNNKAAKAFPWVERIWYG
jgi:hypothetical protein